MRENQQNAQLMRNPQMMAGQNQFAGMRPMRSGMSNDMRAAAMSKTLYVWPCIQTMPTLTSMQDAAANPTIYPTPTADDEAAATPNATRTLRYGHEWTSTAIAFRS
jgi:hypothetical protein